MELHVPSERVPIQSDADGVIRVGGTRVTLDAVVAAFDAGATPEEIVQQYPSVTLADVYSVIGYCLVTSPKSARTSQSARNKLCESEKRTSGASTLPAFAIGSSLDAVSLRACAATRSRRELQQ